MTSDPTTPTDHPPRVFIVDEVADQLRVSKRTVFDLIHKGELASFKVGGRRRILSEAVDDYLDRQHEKNNSTPPAA